MKAVRVALCLVLIIGSRFVCIPHVTAASELIVNPSDPTAYHTINDALVDAAPGDIITVFPGTYAESFWVQTENLTIRAFDPTQTTKILLSTLIVVNVYADGLTLEGLELDAAQYSTQARTVELELDVNNFTARNCTFTNAGTGIYISNDITDGNITIDNCTFSNLRNGIDLLSSTTLTDSALTVTNCHFSITSFDSIGLGGAIMGSEITITDNRFSEGLVGISYRGTVGELSAAPTIVRIEDNVFQQYSNEAIQFSPDADLENGSVFIRNNQMTNCLSAIMVSGASVNMDMEISNNTYSINEQHTLPYLDTAIYISNAASDRIKINQNTISGFSGGNLYRGIAVSDVLCGNLQITDNTVSLCDNAIWINSLPLIESAYVEINGNTLSNNKNSIVIGPPSGNYLLSLGIVGNQLINSEVGLSIDSLAISEVRQTPCRIASNLFRDCITAMQIAQISADIHEELLNVVRNDFYDNTTGLRINTINGDGVSEGLVSIVLNNFSGNNTPLVIGDYPFICIWNWWDGQYPDCGVYNPWMLEEILRMDYPDLELESANSEPGQQSVQFNMETKLTFTFVESMNNSMIIIANVSSPGGTAPVGTQAAGVFRALNCSSNLLGTPTRIEFDCTHFPANLKNSDLRLYRFNPATSQWEALTSGYDSATDTLWAEVTEFSTFGAFGVLNEDDDPGTEAPEAPEKPDELPATDGRTFFALAGICFILLGVGLVLASIRRKIRA